MARAPNPKTLATADSTDDAIVISVRGEVGRLVQGDLGARDDSLVRRECKAANLGRISLIGALRELDEESMGLDSICILWWLARRKAGDTTMSLDEALDRFPSFKEMNDNPDLITFEKEVAEEDGSPEA